MDDLFRTLLLLFLLLFLDCALPQSAPPSMVCPAAYLIRSSGNSGVCYKLVQSRSHYYSASNQCKRDGGTLARIENDVEDQYIWREFYNTTRQQFWIGLSDDLQEGIFHWEDGTILGSYKNWATGEPVTTSGGVNNALTNCVVYDGSGWLLSNCVTSLHNYLCRANMCESLDGITCSRSLGQPNIQSEDSSSSTPIIIVIVAIVILVILAGAIIVLYLMYKKCNGIFMKYICCCGQCTSNHEEVLSLQQENQRLRHELSQHKLQLSASTSHNELIKGWSKQELLSGIPDGKGGYLPALRQSPIGTASPTAVWTDPPPLSKTFSGARVAPAPFVLQSRTQTPFLSRPTSHSSFSTTPQVAPVTNNTDNTNNNNNNDNKHNDTQ